MPPSKLKLVLKLMADLDKEQLVEVAKAVEMYTGASPVSPQEDSPQSARAHANETEIEIPESPEPRASGESKTRIEALDIGLTDDQILAWVKSPDFERLLYWTLQSAVDPPSGQGRKAEMLRRQTALQAKFRETLNYLSPFREAESSSQGSSTAAVAESSLSAISRRELPSERRHS